MNPFLRCRVIGTLLAVVSLGASLSAAPKIGVLLKAKSGFWNAAERGALAAGEKLGAEVIVKAPLTDNDVAVQIQLLNIFVQQEVQGIVIAVNNRESLAEPLAQAAAKGIKIVLIDTPLSGEAKYPFVGADQHEAGRAGGALLAKLITDTDPVCFLKHNQTSGSTVERERGAFEKLKEIHPNFILRGSLFTGTEKGVEAARCAQLLEQFPDVKGVLASGTPATMAMIRVLQEKGRGGTVKFVGFGFNINPEAAAALESGTLNGWVAQLPADMAFRGVKAALALINGDPVPPVVPTEFLVITKDNLHDPKVEALMEK